jgi:hypothetical protein
VEVEDVSPNSAFTVEISGEPIGTIRTSSFGIGELELNTNDGQVVLKILKGDLVQIFQGTELVLSGGFDDDDDDDVNIEDDDDLAPITPAQVTNSSNNNATIQNLQQEIVALQQAVDALQQTLMALQQSVPQAGNATSADNNNNNTDVSPIQEER